MKWFRFYHEFVDDPKIAMMSDSDQLLWVKALCLASDSNQRGRILLSDEEICWKLRITLESWRHAIDKFRAKGMIEHCEGGYRICNWDKRQFSSDSSAERVAKHREKKAKNPPKKPAKPKPETPVSQGVTPCNVTVTPPDTDPDPDPDTENTPLTPQAESEPKDGGGQAENHGTDIRRFESRFNPEPELPWVTGKQGYRRTYDQGFRKHLTGYLSGLTCNKDKTITVADSDTWLNAANFPERPEGQKRLADAYVRWDDYQTRQAAPPDQAIERNTMTAQQAIAAELAQQIQEIAS